MIKPPKKQKNNKKVATNKVSTLHFELDKIYPKTANQEKVFELYNEGKNLLLCGCAGTGKTFLSLYLALKDVIYNNYYNKIIIVRSAVPSREIGHLPGTEKEKLSAYEEPYRNIVNQLFGRADAYSILVEKGYIQFESTSFLRGVTFDNCLIIVDEIQNLTFEEASTVITRLGENSRIIYAGDTKQPDLNPRREVSGFDKLLQVVNIMDEFATVNFEVQDIVRSGIVKSFIIAREKLGF